VELTPGARRGGKILLDEADVDGIEVTSLRRRISMVFQQPNPFPMSIFDNVAYALREQGSRRVKRAALEAPVQEALTRHPEIARRASRSNTRSKPTVRRGR